MATTNKQLIEQEKIILITKGLLSPEDDIHTYTKWKNLGFQVCKGQKAVAKFPVWKYVSASKDKQGNEKKAKMFLKKSAFFSSKQVKPIEKAEKEV